MQTPIGATILAHRKRLGISQRELGMRLGTDGMTVSRWERGANEPSTESLRGLAREFKVSLDTLLKAAA